MAPVVFLIKQLQRRQVFSFLFPKHPLFRERVPEEIGSGLFCEGEDFPDNHPPQLTFFCPSRYALDLGHFPFDLSR